jgi:PAS domain S-box-containing protein
MIAQEIFDINRPPVLSADWLGLLDKLNIGAVHVDRFQCVTACNQKACDLLGIQGDEAIGRNCREVLRGISCRDHCPFQISEESTFIHDEAYYWDEQDTAHLITHLATPLHDENNELVGCLVAFQDRLPLVDLINRVNYEEKSLKTILDRLDLPIFLVNRGGYITFFNDAAESITGYDRRQVLGKSSSFILGPDSEKAEQSLKSTLTDGRPHSIGSTPITTQKGEAVDVKAECVPLRNNQNQIVGGLITLQDLTLARRLDEVITEQYSFHNMVGKDPVMQKLFELVRRVASSDVTVLVEGATGTGKDMLARVIHSASHRSNRPLVKVNCAALPDNLLESEMFGYAKGAFTGADRDKPGRFQEADGGTIFLDEIGDLPLGLQAKLLRVLEDREFYPLGSRHTVKVNVRVIAATNRGLEKLLAKNLFREDLFYRLNVFRIELPCLKDRPSDLPLLIRHILRRLCAANEFKVPEISERAMELLLRYDYPGNVRELENLLEYALLICPGHRIQPEHLQSYLVRRSKSVAPLEPPSHRPSNGENAEARHIQDLLERHHWNRQETARALGINRTTLWRKMKKYGLAP